jgi:gas vesicle protein
MAHPVNQETNMRKTTSMLSLVCGAAIGVAAMYLLDPETGEERRRRLAKAAEETLGSAGGKLSETWNSISEKAGDWAGKASEYGHNLADRAAGYAQAVGGSAVDSADGATDAVGSYASRIATQAAELAKHLAEQARAVGSGWARQATDASGSAADSARSGLAGIGGRLFEHLRGAAKDATDRASDWSDRGRDAAEEARSASGRYLHRAASALSGEDQGSVAKPVAATAITCCAVGAGLMYLMDPDRGPARRRALYEQTQNCLNHTGTLFRTAGQHARSALTEGMSCTRDMANDVMSRATHHRSDQPTANSSQMQD